MLDLTKTYRTRDGKMRGIKIEHRPDASQEARLTRSLRSTDAQRHWYENGRYFLNIEHNWDLIPEDEPAPAGPKPFRYEDCPIIDGKRMAETMDGQKVVLLCNDAAGPCPIVGYYVEGDGSAEWYRDGSSPTQEEQCALRVPPKPKRTVWVNLYPAKTGAWHNSQAAADSEAVSTRIGNRAYPIEI